MEELQTGGAPWLHHIVDDPTQVQLPRISERAVLRADGDQRWVVVARSNTIWEGEPALLETFVDATERKRHQERGDGYQRLMEAVSRVQAKFIQSSSESELYKAVLDALLGVSRSEYGSIAEVRFDKEGRRYLETVVSQAPRSAAGGPPGRAESVRFGRSPLEQVLDTGKPLLVNQADLDPALLGFHQGVPLMRSFMGFPLRVASRAVGVVVLINRAGGYASETLEFLSPLLSATAQIVDGSMTRRSQSEAQRALRDSEQRFRSLVEQAVDAIYVFSPDGVLLDVNQTACQMLGYSRSELLGMDLACIDVNVSGKARRTWEEQGDFGRPVLVQGEHQRCDGTRFPVEVSLGAVQWGTETQVLAIARDTTERSRAEAMREEFVSIVSHELRTPLTSIRGAVGLLLGGVGGEPGPDAKPLLDIANSNSERLLYLINDLLDMQRISAGQMKFHMVSLPLDQILCSVVESYRILAEQRSVRLDLARVPEVNILGDRQRLSQVLANLLSNAVKFSGEGMAVSISAEVAGACARVSVKDEGEGVPVGLQHRIFEKFLQADSTDRRAKGGTGLGLSICKGIIDHHGGRMGLSSEPGRGATFYFEVPLAETA